MAQGSKSTSAGTKEVEGAENAGPLSHAEVSDTADTSPRAKGDTTGKRLRAVFWGGATTVEVTKADFKRHGIDHPTVQFDFRKDDGTLAVDPKKGRPGISSQAADFLKEEWPHLFEDWNQDD